MNFSAHPYDARFKAALNAIRPGLADDLNWVEVLTEADADRVITEVVGLACQAQNSRNIILGREAAMAMPRSWLRERIDQVATRVLDLDNDEWEYRRLLELLQMLDPQLLPRWIQHGLACQSVGIREAADDFSST